MRSLIDFLHNILAAIFGCRHPKELVSCRFREGRDKIWYQVCFACGKRLTPSQRKA